MNGTVLVSSGINDCFVLHTIAFLMKIVIAKSGSVGFCVRMCHCFLFSLWNRMGLGRILLSVCLVLLLGSVVYICTYNHNMSIYVNAFSFAMYVYMDFMFGK